MSESLKKFKKETQKGIIQWADAAKQSCEDLEPQDVSLDPLLLVIEWNEAALQRRGVVKANIINFIQTINGIQPYTYTDNVTNVATQSDSLFSIMDTRTSPKGQIAESTIAYLRRTYGPQPNASLGRCYQILWELGFPLISHF
ncbi:24296_t:CDS:2, partial [Gigaspora rosea]